MCIIELDPCAIWKETERTARKLHRCSTCGTSIGPGQRYTDHFSLQETGPCSEKMCGRCRADRDEFVYAHDGMIPTPSYFLIILEECIAEGDEESEHRWKPMPDAIRNRP